jgi:predicted N-acetyltransferase YhbS
MAWLTGLSYAAIDESTGAMVGLLQSWPVALHGADGSQTPLVMVGPVAVVPGQQGAGIGRALMDQLIADAPARTADPLMMIGDPDYYGRFWGFTAEQTGQWEVPGPVERHRLLARLAGPEGLPIPLAGRLGPRVMVNPPA